MIPPDGVKRQLDGVVDSVPPDENDSENFAGSDDARVLVEWGRS